MLNQATFFPFLTILNIVGTDIWQLILFMDSFYHNQYLIMLFSISNHAVQERVSLNNNKIFLKEQLKENLQQYQL